MRSRANALERRRQLLVEDILHGKMNGWYYSFVNPARPAGDRFVGGILVKAQGFTAGLTKIDFLGINPGGEVLGVEFPMDNIPDKWFNRLLSRADLDEMDREVEG